MSTSNIDSPVLTTMETHEYDIYQFLEERRVSSGDKDNTYTHTSMGLGKYQGKYYIRQCDLDEFYDLYEKAIFSDKQLYLVEKHEEIGPMIVDLDFKYEFDVPERLHTEEHVMKIVELYINEIVDVFKIEKNDPKLVAFVFEREKCYKKNGATKDGIHILFPFIVSAPEPQYFIRTQIMAKISPILADLPIKNTPSDIVDKSVIYSNPWMMFGSRKPKMEPYQPTYIFSGEMEAIAFNEYYFGTRDLPRFFSIRNKKQSDVIPIRDSKKDLIEKMEQKKKTTTLKFKAGTAINYDIQQISEIVDILSNDRVEVYTTWMEVGWALHNIDPQSQELLDMWINFSKRSSKFSDGECEKQWSKMKNEGLGIGSLYHWAKIDNYEKYREIMDKDTNQLLNKTVENITNWDIAKVLHTIYQYDFKYSDGDWYTFKNHLWRKSKDGVDLRKMISTELVNKYMKLISDFNKKATSDDPDMTDEEREEYKKKGKKVLELIKNLKMTSFKENMMKECKELFEDDKFVSRLDTNPYLIGFNNGIYDLQKMELRDGRPDDYVSISTEIDKIEFNKDYEHWEALSYFLSTVFPDNDIKNYFLTFLATCLQGVNVEQKFRIWTGTGGNGKSIINKLFQMSFGNYCNNLPITLITGKRAASNSATPEIVGTKGKRYCYLEEPSEGEKINVGLMKNFTGSDKIKGRALHKDMQEFDSQFKLALLCNDIPEVPAYDGGVWRRMEIIEFKSRFVEKPKEDNEFLIDPHLEDKLPLWKEIFMALLIDIYYANYKNYGLDVPAEITKYTLEYQKQCDNYIDFICEAVDDTKDKMDVLDIGELHDEFRLWYVEEFNEHKTPSKMDFKKYLKKKYKDRATNKEVKGLRFKDGYNRRTTGKPNTIISAPSTMNNVVGMMLSVPDNGSV